MPNEWWWQTFFTGTATEFWLKATTPDQTRQEADFIQQILQVAAPAKLLDAPCGGGRHSLALAERGFRMTGVDISSDFLAVAKSEANRLKLDVDWHQRDMRTLPWRSEFDGAFCFGNSFGYYDGNGNAEFLQAVSIALKPGARFVLDTSYVMEVLLPILREKEWYQVGDILVLSNRRYDHVESRLHVEYTWIRGGTCEKQAMSARLHSYREISDMLAATGFAEVQGFASFAMEPFKLGANRLLVTAVKR
ncbi:MAG TPA: methyltransferase domain-containing protein [Gemmataceae bacterium]|nr:methyltransferase domain-containing protein [Gemmataceae bacterium]